MRLEGKMRPDYAGSHGPSYKVLIHPKSSGVSGKGHHVFYKGSLWIGEESDWIRGHQLWGYCDILSWGESGLVKGGGSNSVKWLDLRDVSEQRLAGLVDGSAMEARRGRYQGWPLCFWLGNKEWWHQLLRLSASSTKMAPQNMELGQS